MPIQGAANKPFVPKIGISARKAMDVAFKRKDEFTMNEFGNVGVVDLESLMKVTKGQVNYKDVTSILQAKDVKVRTPNMEPSRKAQAPETMGWFKKLFLVTIPDALKIPTTGRANRMQNDMEYTFGRAVAHMVNLGYLPLTGPDRAPAKAISDEIRKQMSEFFEKADAFVNGFRLNKASQNAVEICENQIVSRFVHSLVNAHDGKSLENILTVARDWPKEEPPGRIDRIMEKLVDAISAHDLDRVERLDKVKSGLEIVMEKVSGSWNALKEMFKTTSTKLKELEGVGDDTIAEITQFRRAFLEIEKMLDKDSGASEKLSVDAFMDVVKEMDDKMSNAIALGTKLIESKILKDASKRKEDILTELKEGKGDAKEIDCKKTNRSVSIMVSSSRTREEAESTREELWGWHREGRLGDLQKEAAKKSREIAAQKKEKPNPQNELASVHAINTVNKAVAAFAKAKKELYAIRGKVERYEISRMLIEKEKNPPAGVEAERWAAACRSISGFICDGVHKPIQAVNGNVELVCNHKEHFLVGLSEKAKKHFEQLFNITTFIKGFPSQYELNSMNVDSESYENCESATAIISEELLDNIKELGKAYSTDGATHMDLAIKRQISEVLKESGIAEFSSKIKTGVVVNDENRNNGAFFTRGILSSEVCWISNDDMEELVMKLRSALHKADGIIAHESARVLSNDRTKRTDLLCKTMEYLKPLASVFNSARGIVAVNALTRMRQNIEAVRNAVPEGQTETEWNALCDKAENAIKEIKGYNIFDAMNVLNSLDEAMQKDDKMEGDKVKVRTQFARDLELLSEYGDAESGTDVQTLAQVHFRRTVRIMDKVANPMARAADLNDLISDSLRSVTVFLDRLKTDKYNNEFTSNWLKMKTGDLSVSADSLRTGLSIYAKSVIDYIEMLRGGSVSTEDRKKAAEAVRSNLESCFSQFAPLVGLITDIEVFVRERFAAFDAKEAGYEAHTAICADVEFAQMFANVRTAVHNAFAALSEMSGSTTAELRDEMKADDLDVIARRDATQIDMEKYKDERAAQKKELVESRAQIFKGDKVFDKSKELENYQMINDARAIYRHELDEDSPELSFQMANRGSMADELFLAMEKVFLTLSVAKQNKSLAASVVDKIQEFMVNREDIGNIDRLEELLKAGGVTNKNDLEAVRTDYVLHGMLAQYTSKLRTCGVRTVGAEGTKEEKVVKFNEYLKSGDVKRYSADALYYLSDANGKASISRVTIKDRNGNTAFYTVGYVKEKEMLKFTPERSGFSPFTVKKSTFPKEWLAANFPEALQEANQ